MPRLLSRADSYIHTVDCAAADQIRLKIFSSRKHVAGGVVGVAVLGGTKGFQADRCTSDGSCPPGDDGLYLRPADTAVEVCEGDLKGAEGGVVASDQLLACIPQAIHLRLPRHARHHGGPSGFLRLPPL